jgi:hypothetical protein
MLEQSGFDQVQIEPVGAENRVTVSDQSLHGWPT